MPGNSQESCRLCPATDDTLRPDQMVHCFRATSTEPIVAEVLNTHFWFELDADRDASAFVCQRCWHRVSTFHQFYQSVLALHRISAVKLEQLDADGAGLAPANNRRSGIELPPLDIKAESVAEGQDDPLELSPEAVAGPVAPPPPPPPPTTRSTTVRSTMIGCGVDEQQQLQKENALISRFIGLRCDLCPEKFNTLIGVQQHHRKRHGQAGYVRCCGRQFHERRDVLEHCLWHTLPRSSGNRHVSTRKRRIAAAAVLLMNSAIQVLEEEEDEERSTDAKRLNNI